MIKGTLVPIILKGREIEITMVKEDLSRIIIIGPNANYMENLDITEVKCYFRFDPTFPEVNSNSTFPGNQNSNMQATWLLLTLMLY